MKDRCLFKAKHLHVLKNNSHLDGIWVKGYLVDENHIASIEDGYEYLIDPETICQCTGLKDKNGKLIWENDISSGHLDEDYPEDETRKYILWHENGWHTKELGSIDYEFEPLDDFDSENFEVIGNIFDNPELLESED